MYKKFGIKTSSYSAPSKIGRPVIKGFIQLNENVTCFYTKIKKNKIAYETYLKNSLSKQAQTKKWGGTHSAAKIFSCSGLQHHAHKLTMCFNFPLYKQKIW